MNDQIQQIDYNMLLMNHLNRMSYITSSNFIQAVDPNQMFEVHRMTGEIALEWSAHFLLCLIPEDFMDKKFEKDRERYLKINVPITQHFEKIRVLVNLLNRRGLLTSQNVISRAFKKKRTEPAQTEMEFEK